LSLVTGQLRSIRMENPYAPPSVPPELAAEERRRPRLWRSVLFAYLIHHGSCLLGIAVGILFVQDEWKEFFPPDQAWESVLTLTATPVLNLYMLIEPLGVPDIVPPTFVPLRWLRSAFVLTIPVAGLAYLISRRRAALWYLGVISFLLTLSLVFSHSIDRA
jgi:hypothetical protein